MTDKELLDRARMEHCRLLREISKRDGLIAKLKEPAKLVRTALDMFCPPYLKRSAEKWLATLEL